MIIIRALSRFTATATQKTTKNHYIPLHTTTTTTTTNSNNNNSHHHQEQQQQQPNHLPVRCLTITLLALSLGTLLTLWAHTGTGSSPADIIHLADLPITSDHQPHSSGSESDEPCDPFLSPGYLRFHPHQTLRNNWIPFDHHCPPVSLLKPLANDLQQFVTRNHSPSLIDPEAFALPWLVNRTVVLIGDSIERFHARDFCDLLSSTTDPPFHGISENGFSPSQSNSTTPSRSFYVNKKETPELKRRPSYLFNPDDPEAVPPNWPVDQRQRYLDHHREWADRDNIRTSPWICEVPSYGFTIVTLFTFGLEPYHAGSYYSDQDWFITPSSFVEKVDQTLVPLLKSLAEERGAPRLMVPDLIEVSSGLWDLRQWSEEDSRELNITLDDSTEEVYLPLSAARLDWWSLRVRRALQHIDSLFTHPNRNATILWRSLHHTRTHSVAPFSRVQQLDQFAQYLIKLITLNPSQHPSLASRLKFDTWGQKMLGFENHFRDPVHPKAVPGSVLWSDMMLWELRKSVGNQRSGGTLSRAR